MMVCQSHYSQQLESLLLQHQEKMTKNDGKLGTSFEYVQKCEGDKNIIFHLLDYKSTSVLKRECLLQER
jgi:hypothetical protein